MTATTAPFVGGGSAADEDSLAAAGAAAAAAANAVSDRGNGTVKEIDLGDDPLAPPWVFYCAGAALSVVGFLGVSTNALAGFIFIRDRTLHTPFNFVLMNLVLVELFCAAFALPLNVAAAASLGWPFGDWLCAATAVSQATSGICSIGLLSLMGYHRWFLLSFPARSARLNSAPFCGGLVALAWLYTTAVVLVPTAVGWAGYKTDCLAISCGPIWDDPRNSSYTAYLLVTGYFFPVATISATSAGLVLTMKKRSAEIQLAALKSAMAKKELRVTRMVLAMTLSFVLVWSPYAIVAMVVLFSTPSASEQQQEKSVLATLLDSPAALFPVIFAKTSTFINPLLYIGLNPQFQRSFSRVILRRSEDDSDDGDVTRKTVMVDANNAEGDHRERCPSVRARVMEANRRAKEEEEEDLTSPVKANGGGRRINFEMKEMGRVEL